MATPTQYSFELREVAEALIKQQGIHEGKWMAALEFGLGTGLFGATPADTWLGGFFQVRRVLLVQPGDPSPSDRFIVDAAEVNPIPAPKPRAEKGK